MSDFNFNLNVVTGGSAPAVLGVAKALDETDKKAKHAAEGVKLFEGEAGKLSETIGGLTVNLNNFSKGGAIFTFDLAEGLHAGYEIAERLVDKVLELGKEIVHSAANAEDLGLAIKFSAGEEQAEKIEKMAEAFASVTRYKDDAYKEAWLPLINAGIKDTEQLGILTSVAGDIATQMHTGEAGMRGALDTLGKIALGGRMKKGESDLKQFNIHPEEFYREIATSIHVTQDQAAAMFKAGKIGSDRILDIITKITAAHNGSDGKGVGAALLASSNTLGGTLDRLSNLPETIFDRLAGSDGMNTLQGAVNNVITAVEKEAPAAVQILNDAFQLMFGDVSGPDGAEKVQRAIGRFISELRVEIPIIVRDVKSLAEVFLTVAGYASDAASAIRYVRHGFTSQEDWDAQEAGSAKQLKSIQGLFGKEQFDNLSLSGIDKAITVAVHNQNTIHVSDAQGDAHERIASTMEQHARDQAVRIGQELSSHP